MLKQLFGAPLLVALILSGSARAAPAPPGLDMVVTAVTGKPLGKRGPLRLLDQLREPDLVRVPAGATLVVFQYQDALQYTLHGPGSFAARRTGLVRVSGTGTLATERLDPAFAQLRARSSAALVKAGVTVRSSAAGAPDSPPDDDAVDPSSVLLRWAERAHVGQYGVTLTDRADRVLYRTELSGNAAGPAGIFALPLGSTYRWELTWHDRAGQVRMAAHRFSTLTAPQLATMARLRPAAGAPPATRIMFGLWLLGTGASELAEPYLAP